MHELSLMAALGERVLQEAAHQQAQRVTSIELRIGALSGVDPEALRFAAEVVLAGTCAEGASLAIETVPAAFWCRPCAQEFTATDGLSVCPRCAEPSRQMLRGRELSLVALNLHP